MCKLQSLLSSSSSDIRLVLQSHIDDGDDEILSTEMRSVGVEPSSACLWAMVNDFLEMDTHPAADCEDQVISSSRAGATFLNDICTGTNSSDAILKRAIQEMEAIFGESSHQDAVQAKIASCVAKASKSKSINMVGGADSVYNQQALPGVLKHLQREGYNAGLCVTARKPGNATGFPPAGGHRYIDVILEEKLVSSTVSSTPTGTRPSEKMIVDLGFAAHFEIARPLPAYQKLIAILPSTFVGKSALLQRVVHIMSQAARASLQSQGMLIPPWRSFSFLLAKWFSPSCSRTTSVDKANLINVLNTPSTNHDGKPRVLVELDYNSTDLAILANLPASDSEIGLKPSFLEEDAAKAWYPPPPTNQIPINHDNDDGSSSYTKEKRQASVVSALALAFAETQRMTHMCDADSERKIHVNRPQQSAAALSVL